MKRNLLTAFFASITLLLMGCAQAPMASNNSVQNSGKILVVMTNHSEYPSRDDRTGLWLSELTHFYRPLREAGYQMDFASPKGGKVPLDERSLGWLYMDDESRRYLEDKDFARRLNNTLSVSEINAEDYQAIYYTGGHGTMWDFPENKALQTISRKIYESGGIVSAVCHGNAGLLDIRLSNGDYLIAGKRVTGFSNVEEVLSMVKDQVPFLLEDEMKARGAQYEERFLPFLPHAVVDQRVVSGQNPQSSKAVAKAVLKLLTKARTRQL